MFFLDQPTETFPNYPTPKLADFGLAFRTTPDDPLNPRSYAISCGTRGYFPPEQISFVDSETGEPIDTFKLLAHTNVWGVGAIMFSLARCGFLYSMQLPYTGNDTPWRYEYPREESGMDRISPKLRDLIHSCMRFDPERRPTFAALDRKIYDHIFKRQRDGGLCQYVWDAWNGTPPSSSKYDLIGLSEHRYKLGMSLPKKRGRRRHDSPLDDSLHPEPTRYFDANS